jgi:secretion/DNA translocation related TadE-like protein
MSGSVLAVAVVAGVAGLAASAVPLVGVSVVRTEVASAADAAAVAAADARTGAAAGYPCVRAKELARANGAKLVACRVDGLVATVTVERSQWGFAIRMRASAGPPSS